MGEPVPKLHNLETLNSLLGAFFQIKIDLITEYGFLNFDTSLNTVLVQLLVSLQRRINK